MVVRAAALDAYATMDAATWAALALVLTALGAVLSWVAWRRRGAAAGIRGLAWTLVPLALWLTGTLKLLASIVADVSHWAVHLAFSPVVWAGVVVAGAAVALFLVSAIMRNRSRPEGLETGAARPPRPAGTGAARPPRPARVGGGAGKRSEDDIEGMDEIEAILKKHGI